MRDVNKKFSVRYYVNLVLVDEEERRYFKQQVTSSFSLLSLFFRGFLCLVAPSLIIIIQLLHHTVELTQNGTKEVSI